ncbi:hypothetical protein SLEP1_g49465 [Rubroshorea leprosula]|uniref:Uncharacterized protein n=1 Tax=Rubroshorea leprosula TaxID=152421 RepID=A0AAV5LZ53_9ROSI|nr:hypothetical protein SLEP1_g49465 [Rubroshorea leprosula]
MGPVDFLTSQARVLLAGILVSCRLPNPIYPCNCCLVLIGFLLLNCPLLSEILLKEGRKLGSL